MSNGLFGNIDGRVMIRATSDVGYVVRKQRNDYMFDVYWRNVGTELDDITFRVSFILFFKFAVVTCLVRMGSGGKLVVV